MAIKNDSADKPAQRRGRPPVAEQDRKKPRRISLSDTALKNIERSLSELGVKTLSELIEKIGRNELSVSSSKSSNMKDIPVYRRLESLISEPVAVFWSILASAYRFSEQFGIEAEDDYICAVLMKANTVIFYANYCFPDILISNSSALLRWICFRIIQADAKRRPVMHPSISKTELFDKDKIESTLIQIGSAFDALNKDARSEKYNALMLKTIGGLSIKQLRCIFAIQGSKMKKHKVSMMVKEGLAEFRTICYENSEYFTEKVDNENKLNTWKDRIGEELWEDIYEYCILSLRNSIYDQETQNRLEEIILKTDVYASADFWLNEIDYLNAKEHFKNDDLRKQILGSLHSNLSDRKHMIDRQLMRCKTVYDICGVLETAVNHEIGTVDLEGVKRITVDQLLGHSLHKPGA